MSTELTEDIVSNRQLEHVSEKQNPCAVISLRMTCQFQQRKIYYHLKSFDTTQKTDQEAPRRMQRSGFPFISWVEESFNNCALSAELLIKLEGQFFPSGGIPASKDKDAVHFIYIYHLHTSAT